MSNEWIDEIKSSTTVAMVAQWLGMSGRLRSLGPCPACSADRRSRSDKRGPIGVNGRNDGWECHACGAKGDVVELAAFGVLGTSGSDISGDGWQQLREWFANHGVDTSAAAEPGRRGKRKRAGIKSVGAMVSGIVGGGSARASGAVAASDGPRPTRGTPAPVDASTGASGRLYGWQPDLVERCEVALWGESDEAKIARRYLFEVRKLSEDTAKEYRLGLYMRNGSPVRVNGRPVVVIPLIDDHETPVSAKFRSVPVPGTCEHCDTLTGCKKCRDYRNCQGRPLPLYGSHRLSNDLSVPVVLVEGEFDVLAMHTYGFTTNVVSTTGGAGTFSDEWLDLLEPYETFVGLYDADDKGDEGFADVAAKLGEYRCERATPPGHKDAGDCLMSDVEQERIARALGRAKQVGGIEMKKPSDYRAGIEVLINEPWRLRGVPTGWERLDAVISGWRPGVVVVSGETGQGKAQPVDEEVLTPEGWRPIGSIRPGDYVMGASGPTCVLGVFPQGERDVVEVEFSDGVVVRCDLDHLWEVTTDLDNWKGRPPKVLRASEIRDTLRQPAGRLRWRVPTCAVEHPESDLPVDPYVLGILLGDGSLTNSGVRFTTADSEVIEQVSQRLPDGLEVRTSPTRSQAMDCRIVASNGSRINPMSEAITALGLRALAHEKSIPREYFTSSSGQRMELLRGLYDSDGWVENGRPAFCSASKRLADGVADLVRSLGGAVSRSDKTPSFRGKDGRRSYRVISSIDDVFALPRKREAVIPRKLAAPPRKIVDVRPVGRAECVCIAVEDPRSLYITTGYTLTHNTTFVTAALLNLARRGTPVMLTSFEQQPIGTVQKLLRSQVGGDFTHVSAETRKQALAELGELPLWILDHYGHMTPAKMVETMRYAKRRHGVRYFLVDHLGFLVDPDADNERRAIEAVIRAFALVAKGMEITIFLVAHPHNVGRDHKGRPNEVTARDLKGASAIRQDADDILIVSQIAPTKEVPWPRSKIKADKVRSDFGVSGGSCVLAFDPGSNVFADDWAETPAGQDGLLVPRSNKPRN